MMSTNLKNNYYFEKNLQRNLEVSFFCIIFVSENKTRDYGQKD